MPASKRGSDRTSIVEGGTATHARPAKSWWPMVDAVSHAAGRRRRRFARALLVVNPASRRGSHFQQPALRAFSRAGVWCDAVVTTHPGQGAQLAATLASKYDVVFTLGGDGTAMEVVGALAGNGGPPVGILPGGTGNLIARTLGIPLDVSRAVPLLLDGQDARVDLGVLRGARPGLERRFAFAAGVGIDATMIAEASESLKRQFGVMAYMLSWSKAAMNPETFRAVITVDGETIEQESSAVMVANFGSVLNDLIRLGPGIREDDGLLDLCVFSPGTAADAARVAWKLLRKDYRADPCMVYRAGRHFRVETDPPRPVQADGELLGNTPFDVTVEPLAAQLLVPAERAAGV
jgi:diacylglycerol kinase (ATP)